MIPIQPQDSASGAQAAVQRDIQHYMRPGTLQLGSLPPLSLYVHLPWCIRKCPYCDFNSHEHGRDGPELPEDRYIDALVADLESALPLIWGRTVHSIFIGGGTPSLFAPESIDRLLAAIRARLRMEADCEITMEANPGTFETDRFRAFRAAGVTRLSIGVQSFDDRLLQALGRVHDGAQARAAVREAADSLRDLQPRHHVRPAGPDRTARPGAGPGNVAHVLRPAAHLHLPPDHRAQHLFRQVPAGHPRGRPCLRHAGPHHRAHRCRRACSATRSRPMRVRATSAGTTRNYWQFGDYLGIGAGAHSKLSFAHRIVRQVRFRDPARYMDQALAGAPLAQDGEVRRADLPFEYMLNALRLREGFALQDFMERTGLPLSSIAKGLDAAQAKGLITRDLGRVVPTDRGFDFLSDLQELFLAE